MSKKDLISEVTFSKMMHLSSSCILNPCTFFFFIYIFFHSTICIFFVFSCFLKFLDVISFTNLMSTKPVKLLLQNVYKSYQSSVIMSIKGNDR